MNDFVDTIDVLGDDELTDRIIERSLTEYVDNTITFIGNYAFASMRNLTSFVCPNLIEVGRYAFTKCTSLTSVIIPNLTEQYNGTFELCSSLSEISLPSITSASTNMFYNCTALRIVDLGPLCSGMRGGSFMYCSSLDTIVLRRQSVVGLDSVAVFNGTPFKGINSKTGTVYVPASLVDSYKAATNWAALYTDGTCNFVPIEGSEYE